MSNEAAAGFTFLYSLLSADATLMGYVTGLFRDVAPQGTSPDWLVYGHQSGADVMSATADRIMSRSLYRLFAVGPEADYSNLKAAADRIDTLLMPGGHPLRNTSSGGVSIIACYREQPLALSEMVPGSGSGPAWLNLGGVYRLLM